MRAAGMGWLMAGALLLGSPVMAQDSGEVPPDQAEAQRHFDIGNRAFEEGDYELAVREFLAAHELAQRTELLYNVYLAAERGGMFAVAADALERYLAEGDNADGVSAEGDAAQRRANLESRLARLRARVEAQDAAAREAESEESETENEAALVSTGNGIHPATTGALVASGVLLTSFGVFAVLAAVEDASLAGDCGRDAGATCSENEVSTLATYTTIADVSWIAGLAAGVTGLVLHLTLSDDAATGERALTLSPWGGSSEVGASLGGTF